MLEDHPKIFGLDQINEKETIYITEGPFDSLLIRNSVSMAGADVSIDGILGNNVVFIYDNEPRNRQITNRIGNHILNGHSVVIWPDNIKQKDINDMLLSGHNVQDVIESSVYSGLSAKLKFNEWKK